jgi:serine protease
VAGIAPRAAHSQDSTIATTGAVILRVKRGANSAAVNRLLKRLGSVTRNHPSMSAVLLRPSAGGSLASIAKSCQASGLIEYAEPEYRMYAFGVPNDPSYSQQWGLKDSGYGIKAESAWNSANGAGITVAVVDTGVRADCPDLKGTKVLGGYNALNNSSNATDDNGHGTHVSGTIAQTTNNGYGCAGVAYAAAILPVKVLGADGSGSNFAVAAGIRWAADHGARVINLSLGGGGGSTLQEAVRYAVSKGAVVCAAAGNGGGGSLSYPAAYPETVSVGAISSNGQKASFSQYGQGLSVVAPGVGILQQTWSPSQGRFVFGSWNGTSMATPHVAGAAALVLSRNSSLSPAQVKDILQRTARNLGSSGWDSQTGYGVIDAAAAVNAAGGGSTPPPPGPAPSPSPGPGNPSYDVAVTQIQAPESVAPNTNVTLGVQIQNQGSATVDVRVTLTEGPASDGTPAATVRVAAGETGTANFTWNSGASGSTHQLTAQAAIVGAADSDPSDNSRIASIRVGSGGGTPGSGLRFRISTGASTYRVGSTVYIQHVVENGSGQRVAGASISGTLTGANGRSLSYSGSTNGDGVYTASVRLAGGGGYGTYNVRATADTVDAAAVSATWQFRVLQ